MRYLHLRNATALLTLGDHRFVIDPMLGDAGSLIRFKPIGGRPNPLVPLPPEATEALASATDAIVTHDHPDHLDGAGAAWLRGRRLATWTNPVALPALLRRGIDARPLEDGALGMRVETIVSAHGKGIVGRLLGHVTGFFLAHPGEPSVLLAGDTILTPALKGAVQRLRPDVLVLPAGAANFGIGGDILLTPDECLELAQLTPGVTVLNHLEALDHCPTTRRDLVEKVARAGLSTRVRVPADGESLSL